MIKPRIAVLLAAYNGEKYLSQQLDSILLQTLPLDIFISVDHSSDDTYSIASTCIQPCTKMFIFYVMILPQEVHVQTF